MRVISTIAVLLLAESVSSDGVSMSEAIVMASARVLRVESLFDLVDFIAGAGGVFVTLGLDRFGQVELEFGQPVVERFALEGAVRNFAGMSRAVVHVFEHGLDDSAEGVVARRT